MNILNINNLLYYFSVSSDSLQAMDEEAEPDGNLLEDGSEAESPKLGIKKSYTQADLDAAVLVKINLEKLFEKL
jgi:hypothetical protein